MKTGVGSIFTGLFLAALPSVGWSVQPPLTDIFLVEIEDTGSADEPLRVVGVPQNITQRDSYDNQPAFLPGGQLIFAAAQEDGQTDIEGYDSESGTFERLTQTKESEYSPTLAPGGKSISVVRVESDGTQRLWSFSLSENGTEPTLLLPEVEPVGYHLWLEKDRLLLFVLGDPPTLELAKLTDNKTKRMAKGIGRSLHRIPGLPTASYVRKDSDTAWTIQELNLESGESSLVIKTLDQREDHTWTPTGILLMADGSKLYRAQLHGVRQWTEIADFSEAGLTNITRLAVSREGNRLALVADAQPSP